MAISVFDLFKIGIGPSSSHTVGPMRAARLFAVDLDDLNMLQNVESLKVNLYGSLAATGKGHATDTAILLGLEGDRPSSCDTTQTQSRLTQIRSSQSINLLGKYQLPFNEADDLIFNPKKCLIYHANGLQFKAFDKQENCLLEKVYYSIGGGFIVQESDVMDEEAHSTLVDVECEQAYPFLNMHELLQHCANSKLSISQVMLENEKCWRSEEEIKTKLLEIWKVMKDCIRSGCKTKGILPGGLNVKRRAPELYKKLRKQKESALRDPLTTMDWVNLYAIAVNEENAAGGRVVTAPTNGAAGIVPAVLRYYDRFIANANEEGIINFLLAAGAIGILYKENASISGAEVGCQGEVGSACSMAAAGLAEAFGGTPEQVENAAEIGMEHNLGLTCDPINGLVQVPCIERNAMGAIKAINAKRLAMNGDGEHFVSLDKVIETMRTTGKDMKKKYKETARGGLALNVIEC